jgi:hypothetical protein
MDWGHYDEPAMVVMGLPKGIRTKVASAVAYTETERAPTLGKALKLSEGRQRRVNFPADATAPRH